MDSKSLPSNFGGYQYTKMQASSVCAAKGKRLCKQKELLKSNFCSCGWTDDILTPGYPMAKGDPTPQGWCGGYNGGKVWRDCGPTDWLNDDGTLFADPTRQRPNGERHASTFCCDNNNDGNISNMLENIQNLQATEQDLINQLDAYTSSNGYISSDPKIINMVNNINSIADSRIALFQTISANADVLQTGVSQSRMDLVAQMTLLQSVEDQLNQAKAKIDELNKQNDTQMRMVQINTYYGQRYESQSELMKKIIFFCLPLLVLFILKKKEIIPETIANYIIGIYIAIGSFIILLNIWDIFTRSNMEYNTYNWDYSITDTTKPPTIKQYNDEHFFKFLFNFTALYEFLSEYLGICVAETCCAPGMEYDTTELKCIMSPGSVNNTTSVLPSSRSKNKDGFTSGALSGTVIETYVDDKKNTHNGISPYSSDNPYERV
jgi:hypothetical protein